MSVLSGLDIARLEHDVEAAETERQYAAEAERAAFERWQHAYDAFQASEDEVSRARRRWAEEAVGL
jgi:hypothetical protein